MKTVFYHAMYSVNGGDGGEKLASTSELLTKLALGDQLVIKGGILTAMFTESAIAIPTHFLNTRKFDLSEKEGNLPYSGYVPDYERARRDPQLIAAGEMSFQDVVDDAVTNNGFRLANLQETLWGYHQHLRDAHQNWGNRGVRDLAEWPQHCFDGLPNEPVDLLTWTLVSGRPVMVTLHTMFPNAKVPMLSVVADIWRGHSLTSAFLVRK